MSSLWVLQAKEWPGDTRSPAAREATFWLRPGTYIVGRQQGLGDIEVMEDNSVSRTHATITIPPPTRWLWEGQRRPYVMVDDSSKFGTSVTEDNTVMDQKPVVGFSAKAFDRWLVRFGNYSVFRLCNQDLKLDYHPCVAPSLRSAASQLGLLASHSEEKSRARRMLLMPSPITPADGTIVLALLTGITLVAPSWIEAWLSQKVWKNNRPKEEDHLAIIKYTDSDGNDVVVESTRPLLSLYTTASLRGATLLWLETTVDEKLMACTELLGARNEILSLPPVSSNSNSISFPKNLLPSITPHETRSHTIVICNTSQEEDALRVGGHAIGQSGSIRVITPMELLTALIEGRKLPSWGRVLLFPSMQEPIDAVDETNAFKETTNFKAFKRKKNLDQSYPAENIDSYVYYQC